MAVPVPQNGSSTTPPGGHVARMGVRQRSGGNGAKCRSRPCVSLRQDVPHVSGLGAVGVVAEEVEAALLEFAGAARYCVDV